MGTQGSPTELQSPGENILSQQSIDSRFYKKMSERGSKLYDSSDEETIFRDFTSS